MGKFVALTFVPGEKLTDEEEIVQTWAFDTAWEAWEHHESERIAAEVLASDEPDKYRPKLYSTWGDMHELAQPDAYDDQGLFGVKSVGHEWYRGTGEGTLWAKTPGMLRSDRGDKGICYQVFYVTVYRGL